MTGFTARFPGTCDACGERIHVGEQIRSTGERTYEHVFCPEFPDPKPSRFEGATLDDMGF
jgi:hypothetical protein